MKTNQINLSPQNPIYSEEILLERFPKFAL